MILSNLVVGRGAESNGSFDCHGGTLGESSFSPLSSGAFPTEIAVAPPAEFSPK